MDEQKYFTNILLHFARPVNWDGKKISALNQQVRRNAIAYLAGRFIYLM